MMMQMQIPGAFNGWTASWTPKVVAEGLSPGSGFKLLDCLRGRVTCFEAARYALQQQVKEVDASLQHQSPGNGPCAHAFDGSSWVGRLNCWSSGSLHMALCLSLSLWNAIEWKHMIS